MIGWRGELHEWGKSRKKARCLDGNPVREEVGVGNSYILLARAGSGITRSGRGAFSSSLAIGIGDGGSRSVFRLGGGWGRLLRTSFRLRHGWARVIVWEYVWGARDDE